MEQYAIINIDQDVRDKLCYEIGLLSTQELGQLVSDIAPEKFRNDISLLKEEILKTLVFGRAVTGWILDQLTRFEVFQKEVDKLAIYNSYDDARQTLSKDHRISGLFEACSSFLLLVDGNNLIHEKWDNPFSDRNFPKGSTWNQTTTILYEKTDKFLQSYTKSYGRMYRDIRQQSQLPYSEKLRIINSGGGDASDRADQAILDDLETCRQLGNRENKIVISDDGELNDQAQALGAILLSPIEFFNLLEYKVAQDAE